MVLHTYIGRGKDWRCSAPGPLSLGLLPGLGSPGSGILSQNQNHLMGSGKVPTPEEAEVSRPARQASASLEVRILQRDYHFPPRQRQSYP